MPVSVTLDILQNTQALGNIRHLASRVRAKDPSAADAHAQIQDQVDKLLQRLKAGITITAADIAALISEGYNELTIIAGHVTPDLSLALNQHLFLTQDVVLNAPVGAFGKRTKWTLIVDEDSTGNWTVTVNPAYYFHSFALISGPDTRIQVNWLLDPAGKNSVNGAPSMGQPIPQ